MDLRMSVKHLGASCGYPPLLRWGSGIDQTKFSGVSSRSLYVRNLVVVWLFAEAQKLTEVPSLNVEPRCCRSDSTYLKPTFSQCMARQVVA